MKLYNACLLACVKVVFMTGLVKTLGSLNSWLSSLFPLVTHPYKLMSWVTCSDEPNII